MAFLDIQPVNLGHVLVIPRAHAKGLSELDPEVGFRMFKVAMVVAEAIRKSGVKCEGVSLFLADGEAAFQEIFHVHLHVIPRLRGDGFRIIFSPSYGTKPERKEMDTIAEHIKRAISR
jgi:histidine triad (HIT) family protein